MNRSFQENLEAYADLAVTVGLNLQPGQRLWLNVTGDPAATAPITREIVKKAYQAGARYVHTSIQDEQLSAIRLKYAPDDSLEEYPAWRTAGMLEYSRNGDAFLSVNGVSPDYLSGIDPQKIGLVQKVASQHNQEVSELRGKGAMNWSVIAVATPSWAAKVFPDAPKEEQVDLLWEAIFKACRVDQANPTAAWEAHVSKLIEQREKFTAKQYSALKFTGPGTDLMVGLVPNHRWMGGDLSALNGIVCRPNLPTEEIFTLPHRENVNGVVTASMPLNLRGTLLEDFSFTFENGRVVKATARQGEEVLNSLLETDDGARHLGEVALVPHSSPLSQLGYLFYNTLYDENAASHIALGRAYNDTLEGGTAMSMEEFTAAGGNNSMIHVDFMIGSGEMDVDGIQADGTAEPVMRNGNWV